MCYGVHNVENVPVARFEHVLPSWVSQQTFSLLTDWKRKVVATEDFVKLGEKFRKRPTDGNKAAKLFDELQNLVHGWAIKQYAPAMLWIDQVAELSELTVIKGPCQE